LTGQSQRTFVLLARIKLEETHKKLVGKKRCKIQPGFPLIFLARQKGLVNSYPEPSTYFFAVSNEYLESTQDYSTSQEKAPLIHTASSKLYTQNLPESFKRFYDSY